LAVGRREYLVAGGECAPAFAALACAGLMKTAEDSLGAFPMDGPALHDLQISSTANMPLTGDLAELGHVRQQSKARS
jgi:hypothetical protein